ncbi:hypothetical protein QE152_g5691 [Popillia japonica]|uniref:Uncharacterized protein n=1 Tax=Popillia japonica TaxID=7064 RepID=A0AAW1MLI7_POPJA
MLRDPGRPAHPLHDPGPEGMILPRIHLPSGDASCFRRCGVTSPNPVCRSDVGADRNNSSLGRGDSQGPLSLTVLLSPEALRSPPAQQVKGPFQKSVARVAPSQL